VLRVKTRRPVAVDLRWEGTILCKTFMKWEYTTVIFESAGLLVSNKLDGEKFNNRLNKLGEEGWELVSVFDVDVTGGSTQEVVAVLKRPMK
jgi:hypothetical protein